MNRVVIVDDETIVRVSLRSMIRWEEFGFVVAADFNDGRPALEYIQNHRADLLITDMRMPDMDGLQLIEALQKSGKLPVTLVLSSYNEFELVREAFRLGAYDYLLKADLQETFLKKHIERLNQKIFIGQGLGEGSGKAAREEEWDAFKALSGNQGLVMFRVDDEGAQQTRFGEDLTEMLQKPVLELARQLPRISARGVLTARTPFTYLLAYQAGDADQYPHTISSVVRQLQTVWQDYINVSMSAAISEIRPAAELDQAMRADELLLHLQPLFGAGAICREWELKDLLVYYEDNLAYEKLIGALYAADHPVFEEEKEKFYLGIRTAQLNDAAGLSLGLIARLARHFREYQDDFSRLFPEQINYADKIKRLKSVREIELWLNNYFRWVLNYLENRHDSYQADVIVRAKRFIMDNYANPELNLRSVADYAGLNEKYFSTRFTKETGTTFSGFLTEVRMHKAAAMMISTDFKMYEISERAGYHSVEHFNRVFKKVFGQAPGEYRKANR